MREVWFADVKGAWKFTPYSRVMYLENKRIKTHMIQGWIWPLGRITSTVVFWMNA
jgi:hypothetical protein